MSEIPKATHVGKLKLGTFEIEVARLDNGQAVVTEQGVINFLEFLQSGEPVIDEEVEKIVRFIKQQ